MKIRSQKGSGIHFYGCTGYYEKENRCQHTESIKIKDCPLCQDALITKFNPKNKECFLACLGYFKAQKCRYTEQLEEV